MYGLLLCANAMRIPYPARSLSSIAQSYISPKYLPKLSSKFSPLSILTPPCSILMAGDSDSFTTAPSADEYAKYGFERDEMYSTNLAGTVDPPFQRHLFLCYKSHDSWPSRVEDSDSDPLPKLFASALKSRRTDIKIRTRLTVCEGGDDVKLSDGDVLIFPEMTLYRGLRDSDVDSFVEDVLVSGKPWDSGVQEQVTGSYVFVCAHNNRDRRCGVCGPPLIEKFKEEIESKDLKDQVFVTACSHIGGHKYAGNVIIFSPDSDGKIAGNWYGYVTPNDVVELLDKQVLKGEVIERMWRGQMGAPAKQAEKVEEPKISNGTANNNILQGPDELNQVVEQRCKGRRAAMAEAESVVKPKPRPIIRIGLYLISHSVLVSVVCCIAGVLALLLLPVLAKNTYISENALMPGSASPMLSNDDASDGQRFVNKIMSMTINTGVEIPEIIAEYIMELGGEVNHHKFQPISDNFHPLQFFLGPDAAIIGENYSCTSYGINTVGIIRAPRGDGKEAIVMVTPYNSIKTTMSEALSLGVAYSVISLLSRVTWLAKDIIWLAADSRHGEYAAVAAWLRDYYTLSRGDLKHNLDLCNASASPMPELSSVKKYGVYSEFRRAGTMAAALVIKVADSRTKTEKNILKIYAEASNGQMPNLDLINIVNYLAVHGQGLHVRVEKIWSLLDLWWLHSLGELLELLGKVAKSLNPGWKFGIPVSDYVEGCATLASSLYNQALGVPTGPHGAFRDYQVDAITMEFSPRLSSSQRVLFLLHVGRLVEGVIRSVNNLLEKFHQSFFLYLMTSPSRFVSVGIYMIVFALLVAPLPLVAAALFSDATKSKSRKDDIPLEPFSTFSAWNWLYAAKTVLVVHLWGAVVTLIPFFLCRFPNSSPSSSLLVWITSSVVALFFTYAASGSISILHAGQLPSREWALLKAVTIAAAFIGLCLMSVINYATAEIGALLLVPMCLTAVPLRIDAKSKTMKALVRGACNVLLVLLGFPPTAFLLLKGAFNGFHRIIFDDFWNWMESLRAWNSATYIYICMVHLPCWVLCIHILLHC